MSKTGQTSYKGNLLKLKKKGISKKTDTKFNTGLMFLDNKKKNNSDWKRRNVPNQGHDC